VETLKKLFCCQNCKDVQSSCGYYANLGFCSAKSNWFWMKSNCAKSCAIGIHLGEKCPKPENISHSVSSNSHCVCSDPTDKPKVYLEDVPSNSSDSSNSSVRVVTWEDFKTKHVISKLPCTGLPDCTSAWFKFLSDRGVAIDEKKGLPQRYTLILHGTPEEVRKSFTVHVKDNLYKSNKKFGVYDLRYSNKDKKYLLYGGSSCVIAGVVNSDPVHLQGLCDNNLKLIK